MRGRRADSLGLLLFLAIPLLLLFDAAIGRTAFFHYDTWMQNFAFRAWWFAQLKAGHFATWCPGIFGGYPLFAETQTGPLFPLTFLLFVALPAPLAFSWGVILLIAAAGAGTFLFVRRLGGGLPAAFLAGIIFQLSGFVTTHVVHFNLLTGAALLPWSLFFAVGLLERPNARDALGLTLAVAGFFLGSHPYATIMTLAATILFVATLAPSIMRAAKSGGAILAAWALGAVIAGIQLLPAIDFLDRTPRGAAVSASFLTFGSFPLRGLASLANPDVFGTPVDASFFGDLDWSHYAETCAYFGLLPLGLAVVALVLRRDRATFALAILGSLSFLLMLGDGTIVSRILAHVPVVQSTRLPARWALTFALSFASLAGLGMESLLREGRSKRRWIALGAGAAAMLALVVAAHVAGAEARDPASELRVGTFWTERLQSIERRAHESWTRTAFVGALCAVSFAGFALLRGKTRRALGFLVPIVAGAELASWGAAFNPRIPVADLLAPPPVTLALPKTPPRPRIFRQGVDEMWERMSRMPRVDLFTPGWRGRESEYATGASTLPPNSQILYGVDSGEGFTSLPPLQWLEWMGASTEAGAAPHPDLSEAQADLLAIDAVVSTGDGIGGDGWEAQRLPGDIWVSRNIDPLPRVRLMAAWETRERDQLIQTIRGPDHEPRSRVLLERTPSGLPPSGGTFGGMVALEAKENGPGAWTIEVPSGAKGVIVLAESFDPHWRVTGPSGERIDCFRADGLLLGFLPPDSGGTVRLRYDPAPVRWGMGLSGVGILGAVLLAIRPRRSPVKPASIKATLASASTSDSAIAATALVVVVLLSLGALTNASGARIDRGESTLDAAAVRAWDAEAQGAYRAGAFDAAADLLERASRLAPRDAGLRYRMGLVRRAQGRTEDAIRCMTEAIALDPTFDAAARAKREIEDIELSGK